MIYLPKTTFSKETESNKSLWDAWTKIHTAPGASGYDIEAFRSGKTTLEQIELTELPDVAGKSLLHLQCHFGLDSLSWARQGAIVTGVDLSSESITTAQQLSEECKIPATFICSDIYALPEKLDEKFDIVFTSYGVLTWLCDLDKWAEIIARYLKPGGTFYLVEFHPFTHMFDEQWQNIADNYFFSKEEV